MLYPINYVRKVVSKRYSGISIIFSLLLFLFLFTKNAYSLDITLAWEENLEEDLAGYRLFCREGDEPYRYSDPAWEGNVTTCTIMDLNDGITYCFVVRAFDKFGFESENSNEKCYMPSGIIPPDKYPPVAHVRVEQAMEEGSEVSDPSFLKELTIKGPDSITENSSALYTAFAYFSDGIIADVSDSIYWSEDASFATITENGIMRTSEIEMNKQVTIIATYSDLHNTISAYKTINIFDISECEFIAYLVASGQSYLGIEQRAGVVFGVSSLWTENVKDPENWSYDQIIRLQLIDMDSVFSNMNEIDEEYYLICDIRESLGEESITWYIEVEIGERSDPQLPDYYPILNWDPDSLGNMKYNDPQYVLELRRGWDVDGTILIENMELVDSYRTNSHDGTTKQRFTILWRKRPNFKYQYSPFFGTQLLLIPVGVNVYSHFLLDMFQVGGMQLHTSMGYSLSEAVEWMPFGFQSIVGMIPTDNQLISFRGPLMMIEPLSQQQSILVQFGRLFSNLPFNGLSTFEGSSYMPKLPLSGNNQEFVLMRTSGLLQSIEGLVYFGWFPFSPW